MENNAERNEQYFDEYRRLRKEINDLQDAINELDDTRRKMDATMRSKHQEMVAMRRIITSIIEDGIDPTEAKLRGVDEFKDTLWTGQNRGGVISATEMLQKYPYTMDITGLNMVTGYRGH